MRRAERSCSGTRSTGSPSGSAEGCDSRASAGEVRRSQRGVLRRRLRRIGSRGSAAATDEPKIVPFRGDYYVLRPSTRDILRTPSSTRCPTRRFRSSASTRPSDGRLDVARARTRCSRSTGRDIADDRYRSAIASRRCERAASGASPASTYDGDGRDGTRRQQAPLRCVRAQAPAGARGAGRDRRTSRDSRAGRQPGRGLVEDFVLERRPGVVHVRNAPSPGRHVVVADRRDDRRNGGGGVWPRV